MRFWICLAILASGSLLYGSEPPGKRLDLSSWRLTLPVETPRSGTPDEVSQPELASFADRRFFFVDDDKDGVVFRANCGGRTTKGSSFPRCELREMTKQGSEQASWDTSAKTLHTMTLKAAITATPAVKRHVVCAQIHDPDDDLMMIRLEGKKLFIERNSVGDVMLDRQYQLGTPFELKIQAGAGMVQVWYQGNSKMKWAVERAGCYFKAGCYTQSNVSKGDAPEYIGEVVLYELKIEQATP